MQSTVLCISYSLPVQSAGGEMMVAEATVKGKRKEAITQCALEACRLLDSYGMLRQASQSKCSLVCTYMGRYVTDWGCCVELHQY